MACSFFLVGCTTKLQASKCRINIDDAVSQIDTRKLIDDLVVGLCPIPAELDLQSQGKDLTIVPDFVEIQSLQPARIGVVLGEALRASIFNNCKIPIRQVEMSKDFRLNSNGLMALSRNSNEVRQDSFPAKTAIIGTYNISSSKISLTVRRIDIESSAFLAVTSKEVTWACEDPIFGEKKLVFITK